MNDKIVNAGIAAEMTERQERHLKFLGWLHDPLFGRLPPPRKEKEAEWIKCSDRLPLDGKPGEVEVEFRWPRKLIGLDTPDEHYTLYGVFERWKGFERNSKMPFERFACRHHPEHGCEWWWAKRYEFFDDDPGGPTEWRLKQ